MSGLLKALPLMQPMIISGDSGTIALLDRVRIEIATASFRTASLFVCSSFMRRGSFWRSDRERRPIPMSRSCGAASGPRFDPGIDAADGLVTVRQAWRPTTPFAAITGRTTPRFSWKKPSTATMDPSIDPAIIAEAYESDPEAPADTCGVPRRSRRLCRPRDGGHSDHVGAERAAADRPSLQRFLRSLGGVSDAMTSAIGHLSRRSVCTLDALLEIRPSHSILSRRWRDARLCYGAIGRDGSGDEYAGEWPRARFAEHRITFEQSARPRAILWRPFTT